MESFDYLKVTVESELCSQYMDGYASFGWKPDENLPNEKSGGKITLHFKRSRSILNKTELTRLQRHYEACMQEISVMETSKSTIPTIVSLSCGRGLFLLQMGQAPPDREGRAADRCQIRRGLYCLRKGAAAFITEQDTTPCANCTRRFSFHISQTKLQHSANSQLV